MSPSYTNYINNDSDKSIERHQSSINQEFEKRNEFFIDPKSKKYDKQYFSMYQYRLSILKQRIYENAMSKWGHGTRKVNDQTIIKQDKILDITSGRLCWVIGTIFCDAKYKLDILSDVEKGSDDVLPLVPVSYLDESEQSIVMLEDESGRAVLHNEEFLNNNLLVTGCIVAVLGVEIQAGIFEIMDVIYPKCAPQKSLTLPTPTNQSTKIALVSGLNIGLHGHYDLKLELLKQYLTGELGGDQDKTFNGSISQLIIAGNSIEPIQDITAENDLKNFITTNNYGSKNISKYNNESLKLLDQFLNDVLINLSVSIMPGENDPAEICLPQQPLHKALFKTNQSILGSDRLSRLTNPVWFELDNIRFLGTSGQNVDDIKKYCTKKSTSIEIMKSSMKWQNFVPTAPDTLYCYPYENYDPFIFNNDLPHLYFVGNQDMYGTDIYECADSGSKIRLISLPDFKKTGEFVVIDLSTLEPELIKIEL
ncbi:HYS2 [Candida jiufengensis]|uniref:HYS2 n=1 Tax=Candida jiufengensis TaxID=497108 RepID=UPI0022241A11|nr:HYS2 [Candida jiufengensis]KAI5956326.1 HYS2 [Candida jiufengensis]